MIVSPIKTHKITAKDTDLFKVLDTYIVALPEKSVVVVTSKIVSICEGRVVSIENVDRDALIQKEADLFVDKEANNFHIYFTIKNGTLIASAGVDESNANGMYILWPENPQKTANSIREYLCKKFNRKHIGVIITDSRTMPMRWGVTGIAIAHSGFLALKNYIGTEDVFGRTFEFEQLSIRDCLASAAVLVMGEGAEQTPLATATDIPNITFQDRNPTEEELKDIEIDLNSDLYGPFLKGVEWKKGKKD